MKKSPLKTIYKDPKNVERYWTNSANRKFSDDSFWEIVDRELYDNSWIITVNAFIKGGNLQNATSMLEIGCGWGRTLVGIKQRFPNMKIKGIDLIDTFPQKGKLVMEREFGENDIELGQGNAMELQFENEEFEAVCSTRVFHYLSDPQKAAHEAYRVLKPGKNACVIIPNKLNPIQFLSYHTKLYTPFELANWFKVAGFQNIQIKSINFFPSQLHRFHYKNPLIRAYESTLQSIPLVNLLGGLSFVYGTKPN